MIIGARAAFPGRHAERLELLRVPAGADAEDQPAAGNDIQGGCLVGEQQRRVVGRDQHGCQEPQPRRRRRDGREQDQRVGVQAEPAIEEAVAHGHVVEAQAFGVPGGPERRRSIVEWPARLEG